MSFFFQIKSLKLCACFFVSLFFLLGYAEGKILAVNRQIKKLYLFNTSPSKENKEEKKNPKTKQNTKKTTKTKQKKSEDDLRNSIEYLPLYRKEII